MNYINNPLAGVSAMQSSSLGGNTPDSSWFKAMAEAWGEALDRQAARIETLSVTVGDSGGDTPATVTELTAESLRMTFLSNSSHTALSSVGSALESMARKQ